MFTGAQLRMARAFLKWSAADLADKAKVGISTIQRIEADDGFPAARGGNIDAIYKVLTAEGITFLADDGNGIGTRGKVR